MNKKDFDKLIRSVKRLGRSNIERKIRATKIASILTAIFSFLAIISVSVAGLIIFSTVVDNILLAIAFGLLFPLGLTGVFIWTAFYNPFNKRHGFLKAMETIVQKLSISPLVNFTDMVFTATSIRIKNKSDRGKVYIPIKLDPVQAEELSKALIDSGQLADNEIISGKAIARKGFGIDESEVNAQKESREDKKIVLDMSHIKEHKTCHNCGAEFMEGETFCGFCGTKRKDIRRRV